MKSQIILLLVSLLFFTNSSYSATKRCDESLNKIAPFFTLDDPNVKKRQIIDIKELKIGTYNMLNLFQMTGKFERSDPKDPNKLVPVSGKPPTTKSIQQLEGQARAIKNMDLDLIVVEEVENLAVLDNFNKTYLQDKYRAYLLEGNDERGIDIGYLIKKDLPFKIDYETNKDTKWNDPLINNSPVPLFSRDLPILTVSLPNSKSPLFIFVGTHYKSKRDRAGDPESNNFRQEQVKETVAVLESLKNRHGKDIPLIMGGDFNGDYNMEKEFDALRNSGILEDSFNALKKPPTEEERITHTYHPFNAPVHKGQMDFLLISPSIKSLVKDSEVYRYKTPDGTVIPIPNTYKEREKNPSDHFPVYMTIDFQGLLKNNTP